MSDLAPFLRASDCWAWLPVAEVMQHMLAAYQDACRACECPSDEPFLIDGSGYADRRTFRDELLQHFVFRINAASMGAGVGAPMTRIESLPFGHRWPEHIELDELEAAEDRDPHGSVSDRPDRGLDGVLAGGVGDEIPCEGQSPVYGHEMAALAVADHSSADAALSRVDSLQAVSGVSSRPDNPLFVGEITKELRVEEKPSNNHEMAHGENP